jgi:hypothetical protein
MTRQDQSTVRRPGTMAFLALAIALAMGVLAAIPASGLAATKFGAHLGGGANPVETPKLCPGVPGWCTRAPTYFAAPYAGESTHAPEDGVIDRIRLIAGSFGRFVPQVVRMKDEFPPVQVKVKAEGPHVLTYSGTDDIETFDVNLPVKEGQFLAMNVRRMSALTCEPGLGDEAIFEPPLVLGDPFASADYYTGGCTQLVQAVMED